MENSVRGSDTSSVRVKRSRSLYFRSGIYLLFGGACVLSLAFILADRVVDDRVSLSIEHSSQTAHMYGENFAHDFQEELDVFVTPLRRVLAADPDLTTSSALVGGLLSVQPENSLFSQGVFLLDRGGHALFATTSSHSELFEGAAPRELLELAIESNAAWTPLEREDSGVDPLVSVVVPVSSDGDVLGYFGGISRSSDVVDLLAVRSDNVFVGQQATLALNGGWQEGYLIGDPQMANSTLGCLGDQDILVGGLVCGDQVIAYASAPSYGVVVILRQPVEIAFANAYSLRKQLLSLSAVFTLVFVLLAGLSVLGVVRPVRRLTHSLETLDEHGSGFLVEKGRRDEVGALARAVSGWHERMAASVEEADSTRAALEQEVDAARQHLEILRWVLEQATEGPDLIEAVDRALARSRIVTGLSVGIISVSRGIDRDYKQVGVSEAKATQIIERARRAAITDTARAETAGTEGLATCVDISEHAASISEGELETLAFLAVSDSASGVTVEAAVGDSEVKAIRRLWLESLVNHVALCVASVELRRSAAERQQLQKQYLQRILHAQEDERRRIARDLHDTVAQDLAAHRLDIERVLGKPMDQNHRGNLERFETRAGEMLATVRSILMNLRLSVLEEMGLVAAVRLDFAREQEEHGVRCTLVVDGEDAKIDYDRSVLLFRIVQESVHNAIVHGKSENIFATVNVQPDSIEVLVEDDGIGFDIHEVKRPRPDRAGRGLGILGMEERAHLLQGVLDIRSEPGDGTVVRVTVPRNVEEVAQRGLEPDSQDRVDDDVEV